MRKSAYKAGKVIIKEGDTGSEAYIIVDGEVEVIKKAKTPTFLSFNFNLI